PFTVATARSVVSTKQILGPLPLQLPIVEFNGAYVTDYQTGKHLIAHDFPTDIKEALLSFLLKHNCPPFISGFDGQKDCLYYDQIVNEAMAYYRDERTQAGDKRLQKISDVKDGLSDQIVCFTVLQKNPVKTDIQSLLHKAFGNHIITYRFDSDISEPYYWLAIHPPEATKANGILSLIDLQGLSSKQLTVFGDNLNDLPMFKIADRAIAVENALIEVRNAANQIIGPNETDSVIHFIANENPDILSL
ncbi:MAG: HAD hydrolase family protein, partial [Candidatus Latescibacteria bacterium]|nr:HAD hydrolase family protein [Candidatus Latescibacterota bacterium]